MIDVHQVTKRFDGVLAVNGLSFAAPDGAITGLLGANILALRLGRISSILPGCAA